MLSGGCHCGDIRFDVTGEVDHSMICHCDDCKGQSGAPMLAWAIVRADAVSTDGDPIIYESSDSGRRTFCGSCGTGLFFSNAQLAQGDMLQIRIAAFDNPAAVAPRMQVQVAERISWMASLGDLPLIDRFPDRC